MSDTEFPAIWKTNLNTLSKTLCHIRPGSLSMHEPPTITGNGSLKSVWVFTPDPSYIFDESEESLQVESFLPLSLIPNDELRYISYSDRNTSIIEAYLNKHDMRIVNTNLKFKNNTPWIYSIEIISPFLHS